MRMLYDRLIQKSILKYIKILADIKSIDWLYEIEVEPLVDMQYKYIINTLNRYPDLQDKLYCLDFLCYLTVYAISELDSYDAYISSKGIRRKIEHKYKKYKVEDIEEFKNIARWFSDEKLYQLEEVNRYIAAFALDNEHITFSDINVLRNYLYSMWKKSDDDIYKELACKGLLNITYFYECGSVEDKKNI